jgi:ribosomal protein L11 methyltransferase
MADALGGLPLALTTLAPPRHSTATIEALYKEEPNRAALTATLAVVAALRKTKMPQIKIQEVPDLNWLKKVAADFPPLSIARWTVHGAQHRKAVPDRRYALQIDATSAFGTGEHPTTRGCLLVLEWLLKSGFSPERMLDMGCGSGILAMAAAKASQCCAVAIDCDPDSVCIAKENARANGLSKTIQVSAGRGYAGTLLRQNAPYDLIMANIFARPLAQMAKDLKNNLRPGGVAILSGFLIPQVNLVTSAHRMQNLYPIKILRLGEWAAIAFS